MHCFEGFRHRGVAAQVIKILLVTCVVVGCAGTVFADPTRTALSDLRVVYLYDDPQFIDWPSLYYLNDWYGARVDLVTIRPGEALDYLKGGLAEKQIFRHTFLLPDSGGRFDSVVTRLFEDRRPDVVILGEGDSKLVDWFGSFLTNLKRDTAAIFQISKIYRQADSAYAKTISLNSRELYDRYRERMEQEIPRLFPWLEVAQFPQVGLRHYTAVANRLPGATEVDFVSGLQTNRLTSLVDSLLPDGQIKDALVRRARNYVSITALAGSNFGKKRAEHLLSGLQELRTLQEQARSEARLSQTPQFSSYLADLADKLQMVTLDEIGLKWDGKILLRESIDGPKVKFVASLASDGPTEIELNEVRFLPYWDTSAVILDAEPKRITPHQMFVREYLVEVDRQYLEAQKAESLLFVANIAYGNMPFVVTSSVPIWESPDLAVTFVPDFLFIPPLGQSTAEHGGQSMVWRAIVTKPTHFYGNVSLRFETPRGVFAEAYQTERQLQRGRTSDLIRMPFTVSNLFELGVQQATLTLSANGRAVAADTARIRIASCDITPGLRIGFLPDTTGLLEDVLRMTEANFQPITNRSLQAADIDRFDVIVIGSGAAREYRSLRDAKGRLEDYVRRGGSLILLGQPSDWPESSLPVGFEPALENIAAGDIANRIPNANVLSKPYTISDRGLLDALGRKRLTPSAVLAPAENVYVTPSGAALLSVSRLGDGQIIYCGLPLLELVSQLNIEAIHLFANLLNY